MVILKIQCRRLFHKVRGKAVHAAGAHVMKMKMARIEVRFKPFSL